MRTTILLASLLLASTVSAQVQVTGLELALDGALEVERGGALRLRATAFEVLGLSDLRPAAGARVFVSSSLDPAAEAAALTADEHGHVLVELPVPSDTDEPSFRVVLRLASTSGATQRRFELPVRVLPPEALSFYAARESAPRGAPLRVFGRLYHVRSGRPLADQPVRVSASDEQGRPLVEPVELRTDTTGLFAHAFRAPADHLGPVRFEARAGALRTPVQAFAQTNVIRPEPGALLVAVAPDVSIATPGQRVNLEVVVRTGQGRPVQGAEVLAPHLLERDPSRRVLTDARGRARVYWEAPPLPTGARDHTPGVTATREGFGQGQGSALVRVAASEAFATLAVEGGALVPALGGRLFVRVVGRDGRPLPSAQARITGPRLSAAPAASDADGIATLETRVGPPVGSDRCGGETATAVEIVIGHTMVASACVPLDPDGAARVRAAEPRVIAGSEVRLTVDRAQAATGAPVQLLAFAGPRLVASAVLPGRASQLALALPADVQGLLQIRARPLIGAAHQEVRGGSTAVWVAPGAAMAPLPLELGEASAALLGDERARAYVVAGPLDEARWLERILRSSVVGPLGDLRREPAAAGAALLQGALAARTTPDEAAPSVLRGRDVLGVPSPSDPVASGQLRDPWRARSRFVAGRLALILRALE
ncbi:MAG: hypothetical protein IT378_13255, partial [Sandaracinaceae bacterium]|nr:hypothetical protein [Sandaracinaceae bacterium]